MQKTGANAAIGMGLMVLAMQIVPFSDAAAKILAGEYGYSPAQTAWARIVFAALFLAPAGAAALRPAAPRIFWQKIKPHLPRGALWAGASMFFFAALKNNPLTASLSLLFVAPLFVAAVAPFALGEPFSRRRLLPLAAGFIGVLIVLRPAAADFSPSLLWALLAGLCYGGYLMAARKTGGAAGEDALGGGAATFMTMLAAAILAAPFALAEWRQPEAAHLALMALMGALSAAGHFLITKACEYANASQIAPFNYTEMGGALLAGWLIFGELPDLAALSGIVLIIGAGVLTAAQDYRAARL
ncbi:MAG: DMT family transporter [Betaproteobacteria bacterium]|nr:DMT family transporter [Betaproteobacteria bacterium]